jgi:hypothetical protein
VTDSIMQDSKYCYITGRTDHLDKHHVYGAANRKLSDIYGCWVWLTHEVHMNAHQRQPEILLQIKRECQERFEELYDHETFMKVFGKNYL